MQKKITFKKIASLTIATIGFGPLAFGQGVGTGGGQGGLNTITTAVPILTVGPDSRSAALGDAGVALSPDANASYWNVGKLGFVQGDMGVSLSYSPWLRNIVNDMSLSYLSGFKKVGENSAVSISMMYFDLGEIQFTDNNGLNLEQYNPKEYTFNVAYGLQLSENFGIGLGAKFIHSNLAGNITTGTGGNDPIAESRPGNTAAVDIGTFYTRDLVVAGRDYNLSLGANLSNLGPKVSYSTTNNKDFLPTNLRVGTAITMDLDPFNTITFTLDGNKLLVPTPQPGGIDSTYSMLRGVFSSFADAPGGFSEEMKEINISTGIEYWYDQLFALRAGYFHESPMKGNRQYFSFGFGLRYQRFGLDGAYLLPNEQNNPLSQTFRFSLIFDLGGDGDGAQ